MMFGGHFRSAPDLKAAETTLLSGVKTGGTNQNWDM